jgi:TonB family protein
MLDRRSIDWGESDFASLLRSPFLVSSLLFHGLLFFAALRTATLAIPKPENTPISVQLLEVRSGADTKSIGPRQGAGGPRELPKLGVPTAPVERTGKLDSGSAETSVPAPPANVEAAPAAKPIALPGPKVLAMDSRQEALNAKETSADSLVRLPTKESATNLPANTAADLDAQQKSLAAIKGGNDSAGGIKALKDGPQVPGALKGSGTNPGSYGVAGGSRTGTGIAGGGTGVGTGGGGVTGLKGIPNADYGNYLNQLKKRVESVWRYPDNVTGVQRVAIRFAVDRAGKLTLSEVLESSDARLNASALEAVKRASPFPAIPESLKDLANEPMIIRFEVAIRVRG